MDHLDSVVAIHVSHERQVSRHQRAVESVTSWIGRPFLLYTVMAVSLLWIAGNFLAHSLGWRMYDKPPFYFLQSIWSFTALLVTIIVLITQNRQAKIDQHQAHLSLQLSLIADQKTAKIIDLLEEIRRDSPHLPNRVDEEAEALREIVSPEIMADELEKRIIAGESEALLEGDLS